MGEIVNLYIGQCGVQIGEETESLFCKEHGLERDGTILKNKPSGKISSFYSEIDGPVKRYSPRCLFLDLEDSVTQSVRKGPLRDIFAKKHFIEGKEDAASNFSRGHYTIGKEILDEALDSIRKITENCEGFQGFVITTSFCGGTGSGFGSLLMERLSVGYGKKTKIGFGHILSKNHSNLIVAPYNLVFCGHYHLEHMDAQIFFDNETLYNYSMNTLGINNPNYSDINKIVAAQISSITSSSRFSGLRMDLQDFVTNFVPYPRVHYGIGLISENKNISDLTMDMFLNKDRQTLFCDLNKGKHMGSSIIYRGNNISPFDIYNSLQKVKEDKNIRFVDWCPTGIRVSSNHKPISLINNSSSCSSSSELIDNNISVTAFHNSSSVENAFSLMGKRWDLMYSPRAFVHWFVGEGLESGEPSCAREEIAALEKDYEEVAAESFEDFGEDEDDYICGDNCLQCSESSPGHCTKCAGFSSSLKALYIVDGECVECSPNCFSCLDANRCDDCIPNSYGYFKNETTYQCEKCGEHCDSCTFYGECDGCDEGYFLSEGKCNECISNCEICTSASTCEKCDKYGGYYVGQDGLCEECTDGCTCESSSNKCTGCIDYYSIVSEGECVSCQEYEKDLCVSCSTATTCETCKYDSGLAIDSEGQCVFCVGNNCTVCLDTERCRYCKEGFFLTNDDQCVECSRNCIDCLDEKTCENCEWVSSFSECYIEQCPPGDCENHSGTIFSNLMIVFGLILVGNFL